MCPIEKCPIILNMSANYKNRKSPRWKNYNYSREGAYFITINTKDRFPYFGEIKNGIMCLSNAGQIAYNEWLNTKNVRSNISLGEFVVMPDHFHAIIFIDKQINDNEQDDGSIKEYKNKFGSQKNNLSSIVRGFKAACTKNIQIVVYEFVWQSRFHDRVIRSYEEQIRIEEYIANNIESYP